MESLVRDVQHAARTLVAARRFSIVVILTLALGIGANTAVFGVLNAVVLQPLPYDEPGQLVRIYQTSRGEDSYLPGPALVELRRQSETVDIAAVYTYREEGADLTGRERPERVRTLPVSADYFRVLGADLLIGQPFERADERADARVAVVSERIWREYLGGASDAAGRTLSLNAIPHRVVGVVPSSFDDPIAPGVDLWTPVDLTTPDANSWQNNYLSAIGRLSPRASVGSAQAELATISARLQPNYGVNAEPRSARVSPLQADVVGTAGRTLWLMLGAVGLLLVIACVNVAGLFLARGAARETDLAVRAALGSSRWRLARQLLVESTMLALAGGSAGLVLAIAVNRVLTSLAPDVIARSSDMGLETAVFTFSFAVALLAGLAFGLAPAIQFTRPDLESVLRESSRASSGSRRRTRFRKALVVCQVTLALVLLIGAGLLLESFQRLRSVRLGVEAANVTTFEVHLPAGRYGDPGARSRFHLTLHERLERLPGVRAAGAISRLPVTGTFHRWGTRRPDLPPESPSIQPEQRVVDGHYFEALGIPLVRGRLFGPEDDERAPRRVVVSQELVRRLFPGEDAVGKPIRAGGADVEIIGVVGDVAIAARAPARPMVYHRHRQFAGNRNWALTQVVSTKGPAPAILAEARRELAAIDPELVLYEPRPLADVIGDGIAHERFALLLVGAFAALAVLLAAIGIYGVLSYSVSRRRKEMGIRLALGAPVGSVRFLIVRDGATLAVAGIGLGLVASVGLTRSLGALLFGVSATDGRVYVGAAGLLLCMAVAASWLPARAATKDAIGELLGAG